MRSGEIVLYTPPSRGRLDGPVSFVGDLKRLRYTRGTSDSPGKPFDVGVFGQEVDIDRAYRPPIGSAEQQTRTPSER